MPTPLTLALLLLTAHAVSEVVAMVAYSYGRYRWHATALSAIISAGLVLIVTGSPILFAAEALAYLATKALRPGFAWGQFLHLLAKAAWWALIVGGWVRWEA